MVVTDEVRGRIRTMLIAGVPKAHIAREVGCSKPVVYRVAHVMRSEGADVRIGADPMKRNAASAAEDARQDVLPGVGVAPAAAGAFTVPPDAPAFVLEAARRIETIGRHSFRVFLDTVERLANEGDPRSWPLWLMVRDATGIGTATAAKVLRDVLPPVEDAEDAIPDPPAPLALVDADERQQAVAPAAVTNGSGAPANTGMVQGGAHG